jgi:hypothetical protein
MADIFISYSKLSAFLESEGWTIWWDKSLKPADTYRDEIMKQLASARAVIVIWTENSIKSDWVRAEAGRAKADGKLIPVKTPALNYSDIPLPFGEMHTENVTSTELIKAAVVAQLTKPATPVPPFWQLTSAFKSQVLTSSGIVVGAITLFTNLGGFLNLADWAKVPRPALAEMDEDVLVSYLGLGRNQIKHTRRCSDTLLCCFYLDVDCRN